MHNFKPASILEVRTDPERDYTRHNFIGIIISELSVYYFYHDFQLHKSKV